jgi:hypothetical protein
MANQKRFGGQAGRRTGKQLCLVFPNGWGGRREGAGRKSRSKRGNVRHEARPEHRAGEPVHVTLRSVFRPLRSVFELVFRRGRVIADRWHGRALTTPRAVRHALVYLLGNFRKHEQWADGVDPFSSALYFSGFVDFGRVAETASELRRVAGVELARGSPVLEPRSWLLRAGWRRYGLISTREAPRGRSRCRPRGGQ